MSALRTGFSCFSTAGGLRSNRWRAVWIVDLRAVCEGRGWGCWTSLRSVQPTRYALRARSKLCVLPSAKADSSGCALGMTMLCAPSEWQCCVRPRNDNAACALGMTMLCAPSEWQCCVRPRNDNAACVLGMTLLSAPWNDRGGADLA